MAIVIYLLFEEKTAVELKVIGEQVSVLNKLQV